MASKQFKEFLVEFPAEYRHAHPVFSVLAGYINKIIKNDGNKSSLKLLEYGSGFGEHAVFFSHLIRAGAVQQHEKIFAESKDNNASTVAFDAYLTSLHTQADSGYDTSPSCSHIQWQPTEVNFSFPNLKQSIAKWKSLAPTPVVEDISDPLELDVLNQEHWNNALEKSKTTTTTDQEGYDLIFTINTFHIVSAQHGYSALEGVSKCLKKKQNKNSYFLAYGPYRIAGKQTSESNVKFELWLKEKYGPDSGVRDMGVLKQYCEEKLGMTVVEAIPMPEDNFILVFSRL